MPETNTLQELIKNAEALQAAQQQLQQAQTKKLRKWTVGVTLTTIALLAAAALLILFAPPVTAVILPLFAAIGSWSPLLALTAFLPSVGLAIASLFASRNVNKLQNKIGSIRNSREQNLMTRSVSMPSLMNQTNDMPEHKTRFSGIFNTQEVTNQVTVTDQNPEPSKAGRRPSL